MNKKNLLNKLNINKKNNLSKKFNNYKQDKISLKLKKKIYLENGLNLNKNPNLFLKITSEVLYYKKLLNTVKFNKVFLKKIKHFRMLKHTKNKKKNGKKK